MSLPSTVQAINVAKPGDYDVIRKSSLPFPAPSPGDVVIKVEYGGVNFADVGIRNGKYPFASLPATLGIEAAGTVLKLPTDEEVLHDASYKKRGFELGGKVAVFSLGSYAEYISVPWTKAISVPSVISTRTAAASFISGMSAIPMLSESYKVKKGDTILVHTVAGALGIVFTQLAKSLGATVIGTTSTKEKAEFAKAHGADHVILYKDENTVKRVLEITGGEGVDAIYDGVGKDTFKANFEMIKSGGTVISLGTSSGAVEPIAPRILSAKNVKLVCPSVHNYMAKPDEFLSYANQVFEKVINGSLNVPVFKEYDFTTEGAIQTQKDLVEGRSTGKLLIRIAPGTAVA